MNFGNGCFLETDTLERKRAIEESFFPGNIVYIQLAV